MSEERFLGVFPLDLTGGIVRYYDVYFFDQCLAANATGGSMFLPRSMPLWVRLLWFLPPVLIFSLLDSFVARPLLRRPSRGPFTSVKEIAEADGKNFVWHYRDDSTEIILNRKAGLWGPPFLKVKLASGRTGWVEGTNACMSFCGINAISDPCRERRRTRPVNPLVSK